MIVKTYIEPPIDNNNYLIIDEESHFAALIDCSSLSIWDKVPYTNGDAAPSIAGTHRDEFRDITLKYILLTHGHFDHIAGIRPFTPSIGEEEQVKVYMHKDDMGWVNNVNTYMPMMGMPEITIPHIDCFVNDGDIIKLGNTEIKVIHTPGHTQGGVCYYTDGILFSGDTIFRESVGRCDLEGGDFNKIVSSIQNKIFKLPDSTIIYPGHGKPTTVEWEKVHNSFM